IDTESAANINMRHVNAHCAKLGVIARDFLQTGLYLADVIDLRAKVEVNHLDDFESIQLLEPIHELHKLRSAQSKLRLLSAALCPPSRSLGVKLDSDAGGWIYSKLICDLQKNVDFTQLLEYDEHLVPELLPHECKAHELFVLVPVADNQVIGVLCQCEHCLQLGLAAALQAYARRLSEFDNLFDNM